MRHLLIVNYDDFAANQTAVGQRTAAFVGASTHEYDDSVLNTTFEPVQGLHKRSTIRGMGELMLRYLQTFYQPYNDELADLLGEEWRNVWRE